MYLFTFRLESILEKVDDYFQRLKPVSELVQLADTLQLISDVGRISLEVEISYNDIQERCRTLEMYGIKSDKDIMVASQKLPKKWQRLYHNSKEIEYQVSLAQNLTKLLLKAMKSQITIHGVKRVIFATSVTFSSLVCISYIGS